MNQTKFRAWDKKTETMREVSAILWENGIASFVAYEGQEDDFMTPRWQSDFILMQFTGLLGKYGKEIYKDDIISFACFDHNDNDTHYNGVVVFSGGEWQIWPSNNKKYYDSDGPFHLYQVANQYEGIEIIGNIYENANILN